MKVKSSIKTVLHQTLQDHAIRTEGFPENGQRNIVIDVVGIGLGTNTTSSKSITGRLHPSIPYLTLASPATGTNPNYNTVVAMPDYIVYAYSFAGTGESQLQRVYIY